MVERLRIKDDLKYLLFSNLYRKFDKPVAKRKAFGILEAAVTVFAKKGFEQSTLEMIAREAGVSRTMLKYYFENLEDLMDHAIKYIRLLYQQNAVAALEKAEQPEAMLANYINACFLWAASFPLHAQVWLSFLHRCTRSKKARAMNTTAVNVGHERLAVLIEQGCALKVFKSNDPKETARFIQVMITGGLWSLVSEDLVDAKAFAKSLARECLLIAGAKPQ